jgi:hypothetical protein
MFACHANDSDSNSDLGVAFSVLRNSILRFLNAEFIIGDYFFLNGMIYQRV